MAGVSIELRIMRTFPSTDALRALKPSRRSSRRTHSSVAGGSKCLLRQYSASFGTDQLEKGSPRSSGLDNATSTSSRSCSAFKIGGRPLGLDNCSKLEKPLSLKAPRGRRVRTIRPFIAGANLSLAINTAEGIVLVVGCAHPGIE